MTTTQLSSLRNELHHHLTHELLPFWTDRMIDREYGGYITHFDRDGNDVGTDEKSLIAQTRSVFTLASAHRAGYGEGKYAELARHGVDYLLNRMWDHEHGGCYWMTNRKGEVTMDDKIIYGHSFVIYSLSEYTLATGDPVGLEYASRTFDLLQKYALDSNYGGYFEMFDRSWNLADPGAGGGDRKTLDVHMHLMEAYTTLYECSKEPIHRRKLLETIELLLQRICHPETGTGIPQFWPDWKEAPQIKFDVVWGWDRFEEGGEKSQADDNTSYGHNTEFAWLLSHALHILEIDPENYREILTKNLDHALDYGVDWEHGGVYVEGSHAGPVYDREKEFWQQAEAMIGFLEACLLYGPEKYWEAYTSCSPVCHRQNGTS